MSAAASIFALLIILYRVISEAASWLARRTQANSVLMIDQLGRDCIAQVHLYQVPEALKGVPLAETDLKAETNLLILSVERQDGKVEKARAEPLFAPGDRLTVFGDYGQICRGFAAKRRFVDEVRETPFRE